jgi:hypothetical protein
MLAELDLQRTPVHVIGIVQLHQPVVEVPIHKPDFIPVHGVKHNRSGDSRAFVAVHKRVILQQASHKTAPA